MQDWEKIWDKKYGKHLLAVDGLEKDDGSHNLNKDAKDFIKGLILNMKSELQEETMKVIKAREDLNKIKAWMRWFDERNNL